MTFLLIINKYIGGQTNVSQMDTTAQYEHFICFNVCMLKHYRKKC